MDLSTIESSELEGRFRVLLTEIDLLLKEIGPKIQKTALLREEAGLLHSELERRGITVKTDV